MRLHDDLHMISLEASILHLLFFQMSRSYLARTLFLPKDPAHNFNYCPSNKQSYLSMQTHAFGLQLSYRLKFRKLLKMAHLTI